jgi:hypothetical protein
MQLTKKEAIEQIAKLVKIGSDALNEATQIAEKAGIDYYSPGTDEYELDENNDLSALVVWNSSAC